MTLISTSPSPAITAASFRRSPPALSPAVSSRSQFQAPAQRVDNITKFPFLSTQEAKNRLSLVPKPKAGLTEIEPDLEEDPHDPWRTNGVSSDEFKYGEYDDHHTYHEGEEKGGFWEAIVEEYKAVEPPGGFQGLISWLFLPAIAAGMIYNVPGEYLYIGAAVYIVIFCAIEMGKPDQPHNFEPQIYNMDRPARDKLIADYNSMDIWDFNEKYGELWDFTVKRDDIVKVE